MEMAFFFVQPDRQSLSDSLTHRGIVWTAQDNVTPPTDHLVTGLETEFLRRNSVSREHNFRPG